MFFSWPIPILITSNPGDRYTFTGVIKIVSKSIFCFFVHSLHSFDNTCKQILIIQYWSTIAELNYCIFILNFICNPTHETQIPQLWGLHINYTTESQLIKVIMWEISWATDPGESADHSFKPSATTLAISRIVVIKRGAVFPPSCTIRAQVCLPTHTNQDF